MHESCWTAKVSAERRTDLGDDLRAELLAPLRERLLELAQAADAQRQVRRPVGRVERAAGGGDRGVHVGRARVGDLTDLLFGGGVHVGVGAPLCGLDQLSIDEHPALAGDPGHGRPFPIYRTIYRTI